MSDRINDILSEDTIQTHSNAPGSISEDKPVIKVMGVGGGGCNAVNHMYELGIKNVDFVVCNTDCQSLHKSPIPIKVQLGADGLGAGNNPEKGEKAAQYSLDRIKELIADSTKMLFITAGMGGGTGTGAAPLIAKTAKDMGILTVGIVTIPFRFEGKRRLTQALNGVQAMRNSVDSIIVISTDKISKYFKDFTLEKAFSTADDVLATAAKGVAEIITNPGYVNVDMEDVKTVMTNSGDALMGSATAKGKDRALTVIQNALDSPLLLSTDLTGAKDILLNIAYGKNNILVEELDTITKYLQTEVQCDENQIIWGATYDPNLEDDELKVTIVATGFPSIDVTAKPQEQKQAQPTVNITVSHDAPAKEVIEVKEPTAKTNVRNDDLINQYYGNPVHNFHQAQQRATEEERMPSAPVHSLDEDEDDDSSITNFSPSKDASQLSFIDDNGSLIDDKNDFLHNNVD